MLSSGKGELEPCRLHEYRARALSFPKNDPHFWESICSDLLRNANNGPGTYCLYSVEPGSYLKVTSDCRWRMSFRALSSLRRFLLYVITLTADETASSVLAWYRCHRHLKAYLESIGSFLCPRGCHHSKGFVLIGIDIDCVASSFSSLKILKLKLECLECKARHITTWQPGPDSREDQDLPSGANMLIWLHGSVFILLNRNVSPIKDRQYLFSPRFGDPIHPVPKVEPELDSSQPRSNATQLFSSRLYNYCIVALCCSESLHVRSS